jgi:hypothetical protein
MDGGYLRLQTTKPQQEEDQGPPTRMLRIGYRKGWPGQMIQNLVTHAVFQIEGGEVQGYGLVDKVGKIINDKDSVEEQYRVYTWFEPILTLTANQIQQFVSHAKYEAAQLTYTGVGGNCYTPIVLALQSLRELLVRFNHAAQVVNVDRLLVSLLGQNHGMGTRIRNESLTSGFSMFNIWSSNSCPKPGSGKEKLD